MARNQKVEPSEATEPVPCLVVTLESRPRLAFVDDCPREKITVGGRVYRSADTGEWTGFYDWLRNRAGQVIGVRYWPFEDTLPLDELRQRLAPSADVAIAPDDSHLDVYFSSDHEVDTERSADQAFGGNRIFATDQGDLAISFDLTALQQSELALIRTRVSTGARQSLVSTDDR
jgi:hypothetical protein